MCFKKCINCKYHRNTMDGAECWHPINVIRNPGAWDKLVSINWNTGYPNKCPRIDVVIRRTLRII